MNIAFVAPCMSGRYGGPVTAIKNVGKILSGMGHRVSYWAVAAGRTKTKVEAKPVGS